MEVSLKEDLSSIRQQAAAMGMSEPKDSQIVFVEPELQDTADVSGMQDTVTAEGSTDMTQTDMGSTQPNDAASGFGGFINTILDTIKGWFQN